MVAPGGQGDVGSNPDRLGNRLDLAAFAGRTTRNTSIHVSCRLLPRSRDHPALIGEVCGQIEIVAITGASQPQRKIPPDSRLKSGTAADAFAGAVGFLDGPGACPRSVQRRKRA